ncbi:MAG: hypothetical protein JST20_11940 [Bacteroidetes bacterium]|nr:hypothetical protein [Bacteroidota bacterium]
MQLLSTKIARGVSAVCLGSVIVLASCTPKITDDQLMKLRELRAESSRLTMDIQKKEAEKTRLEAELSRRRSETKECNDKMSFVQEKLSKWPNVWPDYDPSAPVIAPEPTLSPAKKKSK